MLGGWKMDEGQVRTVQVLQGGISLGNVQLIFQRGRKVWPNPGWDRIMRRWGSSGVSNCCRLGWVPCATFLLKWPVHLMLL